MLTRDGPVSFARRVGRRLAFEIKDETWNWILLLPAVISVVALLAILSVPSIAGRWMQHHHARGQPQARDSLSVPSIAGRWMQQKTTLRSPHPGMLSVPSIAGRWMQHLLSARPARAPPLLSVPSIAGRWMQQGRVATRCVFLQYFQYPLSRVDGCNVFVSRCHGRSHLLSVPSIAGRWMQP